MTPDRYAGAVLPSDPNVPDPVIDIMMPFYGDPAQFRDAVASVLAQDDPRWRLTVIDDCYPDEAPGEWFRSLEDERLVYVRNPDNLGVSGSFRVAVDRAAAPVTVIMGCDDLMMPGYVGAAVAAFEAFPDASYYQPGVEVIDDRGEVGLPLPDRVKGWYRPELRRPELLGGERLVQSLIRGNWTYFPSIAWSTHVLRRYGFSTHEVVLDLVLQLDILLDGGTMVLDPRPTFRYRRHAGSVSSWRASDGSRFEEEREVLSDYADRARRRGWSRAARAGRIRLTSRLNAVTRLPAALRGGDLRGLGALLRHVAGP